MGSKDIGVLNLGLLGGFTIQRYMGDVPVGDPVTNDEYSLIGLNALGLLGNVENKYAIIVDSINIPFDRIEIRYTNVVEVQLLGEYTYIYDVSIIPCLNIFDLEDGLTMCTDKVLDVEKSDICSTFGISFAYKQHAADSTPSNPKYEWVEIPASELSLVYETADIFRYKLPSKSDIRAVFQSKQNEVFDGVVGNLYLKVTTTRTNCLFGEAQYFKVKSADKCAGMISNPMIRTRVKPY